MSLDRRQTEIEVGAGQTESRINREFVDFLQKYSGYAIMGVALLVLAIWGYGKLAERRESLETLAWKDRWGAVRAGNPTGLIKVAEDHPGEQSVALLSRLRAADILLNSVALGLVPGAQRDPATGRLTNEQQDLLTSEKRVELLNRAAEQYRTVLSLTAGRAELVAIAFSAATGLAAVAESKGDWDAARKAYEEAKATAQAAGVAELVATAQSRLDSLESLRAVRLPGQSEIQSLNPNAAPINDPTSLKLDPFPLTPGAPPAMLTPVPAAPAPAPAPSPAPNP